MVETENGVGITDVNNDLHRVKSGGFRRLNTRKNRTIPPMTQAIARFGWVVMNSLR